MADLIPFPRLLRKAGNRFADAQEMADLVKQGAPLYEPKRPGCANGMPGHPPCRSPAELERLLRASADTTAAKEGV